MRTFRTGLPTEEDIRGRGRQETSVRVGAIEDDLIHILQRLSVIGLQMDTLSTILLPVAMQEMRSELQKLHAAVVEAATRLQSDRTEHEVKMKRDQERIAQLTLAKLNEA